MTMSKRQRLPLLYHGADAGTPCEVTVRSREPSFSVDEPDYRCEELVEDLVDELAGDSDRRIGAMVDVAAVDLAGRLGSWAAGSDRQLDQMTALFREAGLIDEGEVSEPHETRWRVQKAWGAVAQSSVLALLSTVVASSVPVGGVEIDKWASRCEEMLDRQEFVASSALADSDISSALETAAHSMGEAIAAGGDLPLVFRNRWVRLAGDTDQVYVRHFVPGVAVFPDSDGCSTIVPVGTGVQFSNLGDVLDVSYSDGGMRAGKVLRFPLADEKVQSMAHAVRCRVVAEPETTGVEVRRGGIGELWEWDIA